MIDTITLKEFRKLPLLSARRIDKSGKDGKFSISKDLHKKQLRTTKIGESVLFFRVTSIRRKCADSISEIEICISKAILVK